MASRGSARPCRALKRTPHSRRARLCVCTATAKGTAATAYEELSLETLHGVSVHDITDEVREVVKRSGCTDGTVTLLSKHTTLALTINENEERLFDDIRQYLLRLAPIEHPYLHNDIHLRFPPPAYTGSVEEWRAQEPINAHAHLIAILIGATESIPFTGSELALGTWQSVLAVELDGARARSIGVQVNGIIRES
mmetsp:Transcript_15380/g.50510  ORF Transcript_15380/g.50510 Transcript_15380/m.50510 type:complete len:195 (+) Transcript_15380:1-585(+)